MLNLACLLFVVEFVKNYKDNEMKIERIDWKEK